MHRKRDIFFAATHCGRLPGRPVSNSALCLAVYGNAEHGILSGMKDKSLQACRPPGKETVALRQGVRILFFAAGILLVLIGIDRLVQVQKVAMLVDLYKDHLAAFPLGRFTGTAQRVFPRISLVFRR